MNRRVKNRGFFGLSSESQEQNSVFFSHKSTPYGRIGDAKNLKQPILYSKTRFFSFSLKFFLDLFGGKKSFATFVILVVFCEAYLTRLLSHRSFLTRNTIEKTVTDSILTDTT